MLLSYVGVVVNVICLGNKYDAALGVLFFFWLNHLLCPIYKSGKPALAFHVQTFPISDCIWYLLSDTDCGAGMR